jgi:methyltransferase (TIGR00027 family)
MERVVNMKNEHIVGNISDTAAWVAAFRADETERSDAAFQDPLARRLAGERGAEMVRKMPGAWGLSLAITLRTLALDELILNVARDHKIDQVVNLAAGLDSRPYRLELPSDLNWVEVDLPEIMEYKAERIQGEVPLCKVESISMDLSNADLRRKLFKKLNQQSRNSLVITEGLLMYLSEEMVRELSSDLSPHPHFKWWILDYCSKLSIRMMSFQVNRYLRDLNSSLQFGVPGGPEYFETLGWKIAESRTLLGEAGKLRRIASWVGLLDLGTALLPNKLKHEIAYSSGYLLLNKDYD